MQQITRLFIVFILLCFSVPAFAQKEGKGKPGKRLNKMHRKHVKKENREKKEKHDHAGHDHGDHDGHDHGDKKEAKKEAKKERKEKRKMAKAERREKRRQQLKGKSPEEKRAMRLKWAERKHAKRLAKIARLKEVASEKKDPALTQKILQIETKENARHQRVVERIKNREFKGKNGEKKPKGEELGKNKPVVPASE